MKGLIFTYVLTYGGALASLFNPFIGLLIYVCYAIIKPEAMWHWSVPQGNYSRIVAIAMLVGWLARGFGKWNLGKAWPIVIALVAYLGWSALGLFHAQDKETAWEFVEQLTKVVLPFLVGITTIQSVRQLKLLAWVILLSLGYVAFELNLSYFQGYNQAALGEFAGLDNNSLAIALVSGVGLGFFLGLGVRDWRLKILAFGATGMLAHAVLLTFSRGGMVALAVTGLVSFFLIPKRLVHYLVFTLAVLLCLRLAGPEVRARFMTSFASQEERDYSAQSRIDLWNGCWDSMLKRPVFGVGPHQWPTIVAEYGFPPGKEAHSLWMQIGAELGFPGLAFLAAFYGLCVVRLWPLARDGSGGSDPWLRDASRMVIASITGFAVSAQFVSLSGLEVPFYVVLLGAGVLRFVSLRPTALPPPAPQPPCATVFPAPAR